VDAAALHHEYARARREFKTALLEVMAFYHPGSATEAERECAELLEYLA
jgi:RNA polymerase sigma-70 factor (ECF subfamily)